MDGRVGCWIGNENVKLNKQAAKAPKKARLRVSPFAASGLTQTQNPSSSQFYQEVRILFLMIYLPYGNDGTMNTFESLLLLCLLVQ